MSRQGCQSTEGIFSTPRPSRQVTPRRFFSDMDNGGWMYPKDMHAQCAADAEEWKEAAQAGRRPAPAILRENRVAGRLGRLANSELFAASNWGKQCHRGRPDSTRWANASRTADVMETVYRGCNAMPRKDFQAEGTGLEPATPLLGHHISSVAANHSLTLLKSLHNNSLRLRDWLSRAISIGFLPRAQRGQVHVFGPHVKAIAERTSRKMDQTPDFADLPASYSCRLRAKSLR